MAHFTKRLAVFTSGGDSPGMNACVKAVVRTAIRHGLETFAIYEGYQGMVDGGDMIQPIHWENVCDIMHKGGTIIGSARCDDFRRLEGRKRACKNLVQNKIAYLVCIGGDGSLTGADMFRAEWPKLTRALADDGEITEDEVAEFPVLRVVGLVGSIDNDMCGTDMTIGVDTALTRIIDAVDCLTSTAESHRRTFVVEVMGRHCGYLALVAGLVTGADWVFIPEMPPNERWREDICTAVTKGRELGLRGSVIIMAEGAVDRNGKAITLEQVKSVIEEKLNITSRVTILGHIQRGGSPSAYDRYLGTVMGAKAVEVVLDEQFAESQVICIRGSQVLPMPLVTCVAETVEAGQSLTQLNFRRAFELRGQLFADLANGYFVMDRFLPQLHKPPVGKRLLRIAVMNVGAPAPGMNAAVRFVVHYAMTKGHTVYGVEKGFEGLAKGRVKKCSWNSVLEWAPHGGSFLGSNRGFPNESGKSASEDGPAIEISYKDCARTLREFHIDALVMIGGFEGYQGLYNLTVNRHLHPEFMIPLIAIPATISNNLPGTDESIGIWQALTNLVEATDKIRQSAVSIKRLFLVEVMGRECGFLALMGALLSGADTAYLPERKLALTDLERDCDSLVKMFRNENKNASVFVRNESASSVFSLEFMSKLYSSVGEDLFSVRKSLLGHLQQGGNPTPRDRELAFRFAGGAVDFLEKYIGHGIHQYTSPPSVAVGIRGGQTTFMNLSMFEQLVDMKKRRPKENWWWDELRDLVTSMSDLDFYRFSLEDAEPVRPTVLPAPLRRNNTMPPAQGGFMQTVDDIEDDL